MRASEVGGHVPLNAAGHHGARADGGSTKVPPCRFSRYAAAEFYASNLEDVPESVLPRC